MRIAFALVVGWAVGFIVLLSLKAAGVPPSNLWIAPVFGTAATLLFMQVTRP